MSVLRIVLMVSIAFLLIDGIIELAFASTTVAFLNGRCSGTFSFGNYRGVASISGRPENLITNPNHLANASAGVAIVLVSIGGYLALWLRGRQNFRNSLISKIIYHAWMLLTIISVLLTLSALIYVFVENDRTVDYTISLVVADDLYNRVSRTALYYSGIWTPENWFYRLLVDVPFRFESDRADIRAHWQVARGARWNLIPLLILGVIVATLAVVEAIVARRAARTVVKEEKLRDGSMSEQHVQTAS